MGCGKFWSFVPDSCLDEWHGVIHSGVEVSGHEGVKKKRRKMYVIY